MEEVSIESDSKKLAIADLTEVAQSELISRQLKRENAKWQINSSNGLDLAFVDKSGSSIRIDAFGRSDCIGVILVETSSEPRNNHEGAVYLTPEDVAMWRTFYAAAGVNFAASGPRLLHSSGLRRAEPEEITGNIDTLSRVLIKEEAELTLAPQLPYDLVFVSGSGIPTSIPIYNIRARIPSHEGLLNEQVFNMPKPVTGFVLRRAYETKREAYDRAEALSMATGTTVPVITGGQLSLWTKLGFTKLPNNIAGSGDVTVHDVIRFLYLGEDTLHPGPLGRMRLSLPGLGSEFGLDIVFFKRGPSGHYYTTIDNLLSPDLSALKRGKVMFTSLNNVGGLIIFPDSTEVDTMKEIGRTAQNDFYYRRWGPMMNVLYLTETCFRKWVEQGSPFYSEEAEIEGLSKPQKHYGHGVQSAHYYLHIYQHRPQIGGNKILISETGQNGEGVALYVNDWGESFEVDPPGLRSLTARPPTALGLVREFQTGKLPMIPGLYDAEYLLASAINSPVRSGADDPVSRFLLAELSRRVPEDKLQEVLGPETSQIIRNRGKRISREIWGSERKVHLISIHPTHAHVDHIGNIALLDGDAPIIASAETIAHLTAISARTTSWRGDLTAIYKLTEEKDGRSYQRQYRTMVPLYHNPDFSRPSDTMEVEIYQTGHSIPSSFVGYTHSPTQTPLALMLGDVRIDRFGLTQNAVSALSDKYPVLIVESTNEGSKVSEEVTEEMVKASFRRILSDPVQSPGLAIVVIPPNQMERLTSLLEIADEIGRKVVLGPRHAEVVYQLRSMRETCPPETVGFRQALPEVGKEILLWSRPMTQRRTFENILIAKANTNGGSGIMDVERLGREDHSKWILVISPYDLLIHHLPIAFKKPPTVLYSSPFPYSQDSKYTVAANYHWALGHHGRFFADFKVFGNSRVVPDLSARLHASGHAPFNQMVDEVIIPLLGNFAGKTLVIVHGEHPLNYAQALRRRLGLDRPSSLTIVDSIKRYRPDELKSGYRLRLM